MKTGIYEQIINRIINYELNELSYNNNYFISKKPISRENASIYLSRYLFKIIDDAISSSSENI